jgi:hypothetical protein
LFLWTAKVGVLLIDAQPPVLTFQVPDAKPLALEAIEERWKGIVCDRHSVKSGQGENRAAVVSTASYGISLM